MAKLYFDKGLATAQSIELDQIYEHILQNRINGSKCVPVVEGEDPPVVEITRADFTTISAETDDGEAIHIYGNYNHIDDCSVTYIESEKQYIINIIVSYQSAQ